MKPRIEAALPQITGQATEAVREAGGLKYEARIAALQASFADPEAAKDWAGKRKKQVLDNLPTLLSQLEQKCIANGMKVHHAVDADAANRIITGICEQAGGNRLVVKGKSMATEEIHLNQALAGAGFEVVETDLGEFVIQVDGDTPSHIVFPIVHRKRGEVATSFRRIGIGGQSDDPEQLTRDARTFLREKFRNASVGISGVNFAMAESGRLVILENEGNNRLSTTAPRVHIAVMGIEKLLEKESDLPAFLKLLAGSATGQQVTVYTHFISGPRLPDDPDGPEEVHLILLDNGRTGALDGPYRDILRCIRCGACLNACPIYRAATGHAYGQVYPGPLGAVLGHALGETSSGLAKASTLCGSCEDVCPVRIPFTDLLLRIRSESGASLATRGFSMAASDSRKWRAGLTLLPLAPSFPGWSRVHETPRREGRDFRSWWRVRGDSRAELRLSFPGTPLPALRGGVGGGADRTSSLAAQSPDYPHPGSTGLPPTGEEPGAGFPSVEGATPSSPSLGPQTRECPSPPAPGSLERSEGVLSPPDAWSVFQTKAQALGIRFLEAESEQEALGLLGYSGFQPQDPWTDPIGIAHADFAVAETGSVYVSQGARLATLAPPVSIIFVRDIFATLQEALEHTEMKNAALITGPSRTADIEGLIVKGVHGPLELVVVRLI